MASTITDGSSDARMSAGMTHAAGQDGHPFGQRTKRSGIRGWLTAAFLRLSVKITSAGQAEGNSPLKTAHKRLRLSPKRAARPICHNLPVCGRYRLSRRKQIIDEHFDSVSGEEDWSPRYNIAPTQPILVIRQNPKEPVRELSMMRWGLIPSWAKDSSVAASMINARAETAKHEARVPRCVEISQVRDPRRRILRMVASRKIQAAALL